MALLSDSSPSLADDAHRASRRPAAVGAALVLVLLVVVAVGGVLAGRSSARHLEWRSGTGYVGGGRLFSVEVDGYTYGARDAIAHWYDADGAIHEGGWPDCLGAGRQRTIRFAAVEVELEGDGWRPIVAVDCRR